MPEKGGIHGLNGPWEDTNERREVFLFMIKKEFK
jgi:hypothetical protein